MTTSMTKRQCRRFIEEGGKKLITAICKYCLADTEANSRGTKMVIQYECDIPMIKRFIRHTDYPNNCFIFNALWADNNQWIFSDIIDAVSSTSYEQYEEVRRVVISFINEVSYILERNGYVTRNEIDCILPEWSVIHKKLQDL